MAIIAILMSLMAPAMMKALRKARGLGDHLGGSGGIAMRIDEVRPSTVHIAQLTRRTADSAGERLLTNLT
jgi:hypothetical protein